MFLVYCRFSNSFDLIVVFPSKECTFAFRACAMTPLQPVTSQQARKKHWALEEDMQVRVFVTSGLKTIIL